MSCPSFRAVCISLLQHRRTNVPSNSSHITAPNQHTEMIYEARPEGPRRLLLPRLGFLTHQITDRPTRPRKTTLKLREREGRLPKKLSVSPFQTRKTGQAKMQKKIW